MVAVSTGGETLLEEASFDWIGRLGQRLKKLFTCAWVIAAAKFKLTEGGGVEWIV
jgi:hypothetical protein